LEDQDKHALADADPLGVDQNVNFDSVGGLQGHIDQQGDGGFTITVS
jgi:hypothetical protein